MGRVSKKLIRPRAFLTLVFSAFSAVAVNGQSAATSQFCMTVRDDVGATLPNVTVKLTRARGSQQVKYRFETDDDGQINAEVVDGTYRIEAKAVSYKTVVLKHQLLPYEPRKCIEVILKSRTRPHPIT
jgi:hypothetical protein